MTDREIEWAQRLAIVELKVQNFTTDVQSIDRKLDELLELRQKGLGAFWLASALVGTGVMGFLTWAINLLKGG